ncbi:MAG: LysE family translocator [bacterium]
MLPAPESLLGFIIASAILSIAPGPDNIFVLTQSALYGKRPGVLITLGLCTGLLVHTAAVALGVAALIKASPVAFTALKLTGAAYLAYLAWQAFRASAHQLEAASSNLKSRAALYRRGIIMNITNPKVSIFFLAFLPQFVTTDKGHITQQILLLGALFILIAFIIFSGIAILAGTLGQWLHQSPRAQLLLNRAAGVIFVGLALKLALTGIEA